MSPMTMPLEKFSSEQTFLDGDKTVIFFVSHVLIRPALSTAVSVLLSDDVPAPQLHVPFVVRLDEGVHRPHHAGLELRNRLH